MISPYSYIEEIKDKSYKELLKERTKLLKEIIDFEKSLNKPVDADFEIMCPSPEVVYQYNLEYLSKLCNLIAEKYNYEYNRWTCQRLSKPNS